MPHWQGCLEAVQQCTCHTRWGHGMLWEAVAGVKVACTGHVVGLSGTACCKGNASGLARGLCSTSFIEREHAHVGLP